MQYLVAGVLAGSMALFAGSAKAADEMTIAVFTKNSTNPAYEAFRIAADQIARSTGARVLHFVPKQPDNVDEQKAMVEQVLKDRPDAVIFIPVDDVAMVDSVRKLNEAKIPVVLVSNPCPAVLLPMSAPTTSRSDTAKHAICSNISGVKERSSSSKAPRRRPPTASACADTSAPSPSFPASRCSAPGSATTSNPTPNG